MIRHGALTVVLLVLIPTTVQAFDHHHHYSHSGDGCDSHSSSSDAEAAPSAPAPSTSSPMRVFVTSTTYTGALGGLAAADATCQSAASSQGISGSFRAWLSDATSNAYDRTTGAGPWYTTGDQVAFASKTDLRGAPMAPLLDEYGGYPTRAGNAGAWSGSDVGGTATGQDCGGWTSGSPHAAGTTGTALDASWGGGNAPFSCDTLLPIVCLQQ
jgi:hypothetical protein